MLKKTTLLCLTAAVLAVAVLHGMAQTTQPDGAMQAFWEKFKTAVISADKQTIANLSQFPIEMPYGFRSIKSRAQLIKRYRDVFNLQTNAEKCFADGRPQKDPERPKEFTVGCKNAAGDEVIIYRFVLTKTGWKFQGMDNINE